MSRPATEEVLDAIYDAAADPALWPQTDTRRQSELAARIAVATLPELRQSRRLT
jgi:hypothetical protein